MMLADIGADVVRVDRPTPAPYDGVLGRSRRSIAIDLKAEAGLSLLLDLIGRADGLIEAFRPQASPNDSDSVLMPARPRTQN